MQDLFGWLPQSTNQPIRWPVNPSVSKLLNHPPSQLPGGSLTNWLSSSQTASWLSWAALRRPIPLQKKPSLFFIGRGIWLLSSGSSPVSNARLACKQAAGSSPSSPQRAARPSWAKWSCDTDPNPITPRQPALIDPSNTLTSIYILFETCQVCCVYTCLCVCLHRATTLDVHHVVCAHVSLDEVSSLLLVIDMDPFSP